MNPIRGGDSSSREGRPSKGRAPCAGFTLMELIVVVMFLGLIMGSIVPIYRDSVRGMRIDRGISDLVAVLRYAQERAVTDGREFRVYLDGEDHRYWMVGFAGLDDQGEPVYEEDIGARGGRGVLPDHMRFGRLDAQREPTADRIFFITFHPAGTSDVASLEIQQTEHRARPFRIEVLGRMGRVEVEDPRS